MILVALLFAVSDVVWQALIAGIVAIVLAYMQQRTKNAVDSGTKKAVESAEGAARAAEAAAGHAVQVKEDLKTVKDDIRKVELATNSMKDELVATTGLRAMAEGEAKGRADQKAEHERER